jgi:choline-sulfatase
MASGRALVSGPLARSLRAVVDLDADGSGSLLGGADCDDTDPHVSPRAVELVANGIDDNCSGGDLRRVELPGDGYDRPPRARSERRPDVVLLSLDAVRPDYVTATQMPNLHRLMRQGITGRVAYTVAPYTGHAMVGMMTSTPPIDHTFQRRFFGMEPSLAEVLRHVGYRSLAVHCIADLPLDMVSGFDYVDNRLGPACRDFRATTSEKMSELVLSYLSERASPRQPLFLWAHFTDPHLPYVGGYLAELARVDRALGRIVARLQEDTVVVVVSDHGESFGSHGFLGHIWRLDEELLRVVLTVRGPQTRRRDIEYPVSLIDVAPTVSELVGASRPAGWQGVSLLRDPPERTLVFESRYKRKLDLRGIRWGRYKLTYDRRNNSYELFDLQSDPFDRHNLVAEAPEMFERMRMRLGQTFDQLYNDRRLVRKLRLFDSRRGETPDHIGPLNVGYSALRRTRRRYSGAKARRR